MTVTFQDVTKATGHWFECEACSHVGTAETIPEMIEVRHSHLRENHPERWVKA